MRKNIVLTTLVAGSLALSLAACGGKPAEENVETDEVAAQEAELAEQAAAPALTESEAVGIAFTNMGIDQAEGVVIYECPNGGAWDVTVTANGDAHFFEIATDTGEVRKHEAVQCASFATDGPTAEEIAQSVDGAGVANDYQAIYHEVFGWGWDVTVAGAGSVKQYHVSPEGVCNLIEEIVA